MNKNSIRAYNEIKQDGTLAAREQSVLKVIKLYGPINGRRIDILVNGGHKRIKSLLECGVIEIFTNSIDHETGKIVAYYKATGKKPTRPQVIRKSHPLDLSGLYDKAYEQGVIDAVKHFVKDGDTVAALVNAICEAIK